jgi:UDP-N-acetylmuramate dehydrogenase
MVSFTPHMTKTLPDTFDALAARLPPGRIQRNKVLAPYTTFRIGGPADLFIEAASADELAAAVLAARELGVPYFVLGLGANILIADKGVRGLVIRNTARHHEFRPEGESCRLWTESGAIVKELIQESVAAGWSGLEHYVGIPSTIGGAIWQNLHFLSPGPERERTMFIAEVFESCEILSEESERRTVGADYVQFGYDDSVFHHRRDIVLSVTFRLTRGDPATLHRILQENLSWRGSRHPWLDWHPSAGSVFKKIEGVGAGRLVDQCGLKGFRVGDAQISHIHANIMVNLGRATAADVRALIATAQLRVEDRFGMRLETEIGMIGEF